ncbi:MAG: di-trans,poly-cis-decaprenylcistransferase [Firmicutes bacterium]|nr:di-trans,poly-cis-decaprenylcistransferase [Bacillota bacterium]
MDNLPVHVAIIMDGNGRWAKKKKLPRLAGHNAGMLAMKEIVRCASDMGIKYLTVYAFSTENWKRSMEEVSGIFGLLVKYVASELAELNEENVRVRVFGDYSVIPEAAKASLDKTLTETEGNTGMQFNIALNYGSRAEIIRAVNSVLEERVEAFAARVKNIDKSDAEGDSVSGSEESILPITEEELSAHLYSGNENGNVPDPDLVIRTSGEERISNFMLWQIAYSEFAFTDTLWPDFTTEEFTEIIESYGTRERRFGGRKK